MSAKSTWWSITINNPVDADRELLKTPPDFVKHVVGQDEIGEEGTLHLQYAVQCKSQQRFSAIKAWLPRAHIEPARNVKALQNYVTKTESAVEGTQFSTTSASSYITPSAFPRWLAKYFQDQFISTTDVPVPDDVNPEWAAEWAIRRATRNGFDVLHLWRQLRPVTISFWAELSGYGEDMSLDEFIADLKKRRVEGSL